MSPYFSTGEKQMKEYIDELAPWEKKKGYYQNIEPGKKVFAQRMDIRNQIREMIVTQIGITSTTVTSKEIVNDIINSIADDDRNIGNGIFGLKAAFEWGISEVVWQIEQNTKEFKNIIKVLYAPLSKLLKDMRLEAQVAYEKGKMADALINYLELSQVNKKDFSVYISLGIFYLFYEVNKEKALYNFDKAIEITKSHSDYYTSYALLYKALILRDLGRIKEAEECSRQAMDLTPYFSEAIYQNAQYNALLNKPEDAIPLLKQVINHDVLYCLKINNERDFHEIKPHISKMFEEIRDKINKRFKNKLKKFDKKVYYFNNIINNIREQGYNIPNNFNVELLQEKRDELADKINYKTILDEFISDYSFSKLGLLLNQDILSLKDICKEIRNRLKIKKDQTGKKLLEVKKKISFSHFFIYTLLIQVYAIPIGLSFRASFSTIILEVVVFVSCFLLVIITPRLKWKNIYYHLKKEEYKLFQIVKRIEAILLN